MRYKTLNILAAFSVSVSSYAQTSLPIQGKGMYIWELWISNGGGKNLNAVVSKLGSLGVTWIVIKMADGNSYYNSSGHSLYSWATSSYGSMDSVISIFHSNGIKVCAFQYVYGVPYYHSSYPTITETDVANSILDAKGIDGLIIDAEIEFDTLATRVAMAQTYCDTIRAHHPNGFVGLTSWARVYGHTSFPWTTFLDRVQVNMPQAYWASRSASPQYELSNMSSQFTTFTQTWATQGDSAANKPIMPIGQAEYFGSGTQVVRGDVAAFCNLSQQTYHYPGVSLWEYNQIDSQFVWDEYSAAWPSVSVSQEPDDPLNFSLSQNYPNPFNPSTVIGYQLSGLSHVILKVYDVLGREVATLVNGQEKPGKYEVRFDGSRFASGVYFYRLSTSAGFMEVKKMVIEK